MSTWHTVCSVGSLLEGDRKVVVINNQSIGIFHQDGQYFAIENNCPHEHLPLCDDGLIVNGEITCPYHGARFCLQTGEVTAPPAFESIQIYPIRVEEGHVKVWV